MKNKLVGFNYLHRHTKTEQMLNVDADHVIVDRSEWEEVVAYFHLNPHAISELGKNPFISS